MDSYDFIVVGSGPGGYIAAIRASQLGYKVALVEKEASLGGVCLNWGCIPTKSLLKSAEAYKKVKEAASFGIKVEGKVTVDIDAIVGFSRSVVSKLGNGVSMLMKKNEVDVIHGTAKLLGNGKVDISGDKGSVIKSARHIILATGATARTIPSLDEKLMWTARDAMLTKVLPKSLIIIGSGAIGIEFASFFNTLGSKVTIVEMQNRILPLEDHDISKAMHDKFRKLGVEIFTGSCVKDLKKRGQSILATISDDKSKEIVLECSNVLSAVGVIPNSSNLGLENTGVKLCDRGFILVDDLCRTNETGIYAIGDVVGAPCLAHKASHEALICVEGIARDEGITDQSVHALVRKNIPSCTYSTPQIASIGLTEEAARKEGLDIKVGISNASSNGKALASGDSEGFVKVVVCASSGELLGAHMIGNEVTEMISTYVAFSQLEASDLDIVSSIFPHPTLSEMMHSAILSALKRPLDS